MVVTVKPDTIAPAPALEASPAAGLIVDRAVAAIAAAADTVKGYREILKGIHIRDGRAYSADGYRAMAVDLPAGGDSKMQPLTLEAAGLEAAVKSLSGRARVAPVITGEPAAVPAGDVAPGVMVPGYRLEAAGNTAGVRMIEGLTYPDIQHVIDSAPEYPAPSQYVAFNPRMMAELLEAMARAGVECVTMHIVSPLQAIRLTGEIDETRDIDAVLMPMVRGDDAAAARKARKARR